MDFTKEFLLKVIEEDFDESEGIKVISDKVVDNARWTVEHELLFKYNDKFYQTYYSRGATEYQEEGPFEYYKSDDIIEVDEVAPVEKTIIVYEPVE